MGADDQGSLHRQVLGTVQGATSPARAAPLDSSLYRQLLETAEGARWRTSDVAWSSFRPELTSPALCAAVREMAFHEQATFSATQRFMQAFSDDPDFTQWVSVWFYEETRHPQALMRWAEMAGVTFDASFVARGRVSTPFMRSRMGTLVTNVISEVTAALAYLNLARASPEPLLSGLCRRIAADEARHSASFFTYARRRLESAADPERERLDAVKVLHFWLNENGSVTHPVNRTMERLRGLDGIDPAVLQGLDTVRARACAAVGLLTGEPIRTPADVEPILTALVARAHAPG
ncbi:MAG TPA: ferritin-like domain-containing protein [Myxococcaceae bacterium]|nr:ferritin-like domain-containing protein [Myxococcaceae bacterium]